MISEKYKMKLKRYLLGFTLSVTTLFIR